MRAIFKNLTGSVAAVLLLTGLSSCDKVKNPNQNAVVVAACVPPTPPSLVGNNFVHKTNTAKMNFRKVLIEDYTGHLCGNCPRAAETATTLLNKYKDSVIVLTVHAGYTFSKPSAPDYPEDFRTTAGDDWDKVTGGFGISNAGNPNGMVNRRDFPTNTHVKAYSLWNSLTAPYLRTGQDVTLELTSDYDTVGRKLNVDVKTTFLKTFSDATKMCLVFSEDSIIAHQKDYAPPASSVVINGDERTDYVFDTMLRGAINGTWGETVVDNCDVKSYRGVVVNSAFNDKHLYIVSFLYNDATKEVIQVEKLKIR